ALDPAALTEVSVVPSKLPKRTDWLFTFADRSRTLPRGELRLSTRIAGEEVADVRRFVFVPEDWERSERNAQIIATVVQGAGLLLTIAIGLAGAITAIVSWSRHRFSVRVGLAVTGTFICLAAIPLINGFPALLAALST